MDYELELGVVIGREGTNLSPDQVEAHVFGFTILNDFSARDIQFREMEGRLGPCKGKHFACSSGPLLATIDELDWRGGLRMQASLNGETLCDGNSNEAIFGLDEVVAWASQAEILRPGWLLGSGTVNGGSTIEHDRKLGSRRQRRTGDRGPRRAPEHHRPQGRGRLGTGTETPRRPLTAAPTGPGNQPPVAKILCPPRGGAAR